LTLGLYAYFIAYKYWLWDAGVVICLGQVADLHMAQLMSLLQ